MVNRWPARFLVLAVSLLLLAPRAAQSSCNTPPPADSVPGDSGSMPKGYKGALGRINRAFYIPGISKSIVLVPDGICVADPKTQRLKDLLGTEDSKDLIVLLALPAAAGSKTALRVWADKATCQTLLAKSPLDAASATSDKGVPAVTIMACSPDGVETVPTETKYRNAGLRDGIKVTLPSPEELRAAMVDTDALVAPRIVALRNPNRAIAGNALGTWVQTELTKQCNDLCRPSEQGLLVCIDKLYSTTIDRAGAKTYSSDQVLCTTHFGSIPGAVDVALACEPDGTGPCPPAGAPLDDVKVWLDECGGAHVPLLWENVLPIDGGRIGVGGRTGIGRGSSPYKGSPIKLPGREFVGSTPVADPEGDGTGVDWRRPDIEPWELTSNDLDFGLKGTVDKPDSVIHIYPQLPVSLFCEGGSGDTENACFGVERKAPPNESEFEVTCACTDRHPVGCTCKPQSSTARLFVCGSDSGSQRGKPCTRDSHCGSGTCNGVPHCQKPPAVWTGQNDSTGHKCYVSEDCPPKDDITKDQDLTQCGYRLFDLREAIDTPDGDGSLPTGRINLDSKLKQNGHKRRGMCENGGVCGNSNEWFAPGPCRVGECRGRTLKVGLP